MKKLQLINVLFLLSLSFSVHAYDYKFHQITCYTYGEKIDEQADYIIYPQKVSLSPVDNTYSIIPAYDQNFKFYVRNLGDGTVLAYDHSYTEEQAMRSSSTRLDLKEFYSLRRSTYLKVLGMGSDYHLKFTIECSDSPVHIFMAKGLNFMIKNNLTRLRYSEVVRRSPE